MSFAFVQRASTAGPERPIVPAVRRGVERATGRSLAGARLHVGGASDAAARSLRADAFTVGRDVHVASARYRPGTSGGDRLVAHELAHVAQQGARTVPAGASLAVRAPGDGAEREADAVAERASGGTLGGPASVHGVQSVAPAVQRAVSQKQTVGVDVKAADVKSLEGGTYWTQRLGTIYDLTVPARFGDAEERDAVLSVAHALHTRLGTPTKANEQLLHIPARGTTTPPLAYRAKFTPAADADSRPSLELEFVAEGADVAAAVGKTAASTIPTNYAGRGDAADAEIDMWKAKKATNTLGAISWKGTVPAAELVAAKFALLGYAEHGTRNAEVDAIVPLSDGTTRVLYTFVFSGAANDVEVERIGPAGTGTQALDPATRTFDVKRVSGYTPEFDADAAKLKTWLATRYPAIVPAGTDAPAIVTDVNTKLDAAATTPAFFGANYGMPVVDAAGAATRLTTAHGWDAQRAADTKTFSTADLKLVELSLELLADPMLKLVRGATLARQKVALEKVTTPGKKGAAPTVTYEADESTRGEAIFTGSDRTLLVYDSITQSDASMFIGTGANASPMSAMTMVHEFGHLVGWSASVLSTFNATFANQKSKLNAAPVTWYAASGPQTEFFPEAFAIFNADPAWMQANVPAMHAWFVTLTTTGAPPAAGSP